MVSIKQKTSRFVNIKTGGLKIDQRLPLCWFIISIPTCNQHPSIIPCASMDYVKETTKGAIPKFFSKDYFALIKSVLERINVNYQTELNEG